MDVDSGEKPAPGPMDPAARAELARALAAIEGGGGLMLRLASLLTGAVGAAGRAAALLALGSRPALRARFAGIAELALSRAYDVAILGVERPGLVSGTPGRSRALVALSGAAGGAAGLAGFVPDAMVTTLAILREVARIAREEGEDLQDEEARRACLEVFGLAGETPELGYYSARLMLRGAPLVARMSEIAARYGVTLGQKLTLQAVPLLGAATGAALNAAFLEHFRRLARAHFTIRRLQRRYGTDIVTTWMAGRNAT
jgi:hypothetical protein